MEVDRLPRVEHDGPRRLGMVVAGALPVVQRGAEAVEAAVRPHRVEPRRRVLLASARARPRPAPAARRRRAAVAVGQALRPGRRVTAPAEVGAPDLAGAEAEARGPCHQQERRVVAGAAVPGLAQPGAEPELPPLRVALAAPAAGEVEHLRAGGGTGRTQRELVEPVGPSPLVAQRVAQPQDARGRELDFAAQRQQRDGVARVDREALGPGQLGRHEPEGGREVLAPARAAQPGPAAVPGGPLGQQRRRHRRVERGLRGGRRERVRDRGGVAARVGAPVQDAPAARGRGRRRAARRRPRAAGPARPRSRVVGRKR